MKVELAFDLGYVTVGTDTGHGEVEHLWIDGQDYANRSAIDLFHAVVSRPAFQRRLSDFVQTEEKGSTSNG